MVTRLGLCLLAAAAMWGQEGPRLFGGASVYDGARERAGRLGWAKSVVDGVVSGAAAWPASHLTKYGLKELALPPEGGQWTLWDVCPVHGVSLRYAPPSTKTCPVDGKTYGGWPYDQVTYDRRFDDLATAARDLALAWRWTGERAHAEKAAWILREFAAKYAGYALHDKDGKTARSGARVHAQTLDEAIWLIPVAWAYDLLRDAGVLDEAGRGAVEAMLREAVRTIERNDAGVSNWQSWHNAGIAAVGFALGDAGLIDESINGKSGFRFQMKSSVTPDGFWYEGAWGYHFYALDALVRQALMARANGVDLFEEQPLKRMFEAPLFMVLPSGNLPAFNDSKEVNLYGYDTLYEAAWGVWREPGYAMVLGTRSRSLNALLFGEESVPSGALEGLSSMAFPESGYVVLRAGGGDHTVAMKYGPHGGGHGHYDKLGLVTYALGSTLALDPGTQSYAAPTHATWDKATIAHNTVTVDEAVQKEATGRLEWAELEGVEYKAARASGGAAYAQASLTRTVVVTPEYALDLFGVESRDGAEHVYDWAYHNNGAVVDAGGLEMGEWAGFGGKNGYQHLSETKAAETGDGWRVTIDATRGTAVAAGSVYNSASTVAGTMAASDEQAVTAPNAAKLGYTFNGAGYILYTASALGAQPERVPAGAGLWVYGDESGHLLAFRINDASDERFVTPRVKVDWRGWRRLEFSAPESWSHYLGNADGKMDLPLRSVGIEWTNAGGDAPKTGAIYWDEVLFWYEGGEERLGMGWDPPKRKVRLWMLGESGTTVVSGRGLSATLPATAAAVVARRRGVATEFATLIEPFEETPRVTVFERDGEGRFVVEGAGFRDTFRVEADGVKEFVRERR